MSYPNPGAYLQASVETASPARLLVMLYDRLALDCRRALAAQEGADHASAHSNLLHAQEIVAHLQSSLRPELWAGGPALSSLYSHLLVHLVRANVDRDVEKTAHCLELVEGLGAAWREAAAETAVAAS
ncbi:flagellar export chaperone FliS [Nocardioides KLBMP 9356]|uniref:Flagellar export chaperone FliS n=1 Tax=Nocardioides potassii TaxID=2911371 RepID=A0ABS9HDP6_9ACTN|nr:flagellar export chaperone FliS [Nocardioides potassii]MCF6378246.1 flagellar export chaperone FliS [Nocardioides potassii]